MAHENTTPTRAIINSRYCMLTRVIRYIYHCYCCMGGGEGLVMFLTHACKSLNFALKMTTDAAEEACMIYVH